MKKKGFSNKSIFIQFFTEWCTIKGHDPHFENVEATELNTLLRSFYAEVRKADGEPYAKPSYVGLRAAIHRHLISEPHNRQLNILRDREFNSANNVFMGMVKKLKRDGRDQSQHKQPISQGDLQKLMKSTAMSPNTPTGLQNLVWFYIEYFFCRRGREGLRNLAKDSFVFEFDDEGLEFCALRFNEATKNHPGTMNQDYEPQKRMYAADGSNCPVAMMKLYLSKLNTKCTSFFQRPKRVILKESTCWYDNMPAGKNYLGNRMKSISKEAELSRAYTNHCIRATVITQLNNAGFESRTIATLSGHRNEDSIKSYCKDASSIQKRGMSQSLANTLQGRGIPVQSAVGDHTNTDLTLGYRQSLQSMFSNCTFQGTVNVTLNRPEC